MKVSRRRVPSFRVMVKPTGKGQTAIVVDEDLICDQSELEEFLRDAVSDIPTQAPPTSKVVIKRSGKGEKVIPVATGLQATVSEVVEKIKQAFAENEDSSEE